MLPPSLAASSLLASSHDVDAALTETVALIVRAGARMLLFGAGRPVLITALAARGLHVIVVDSSRTALRRTSTALGETPGVEYLVSDPRELDVPGRVAAVLVPAMPWRTITLPHDRATILRRMRARLAPGGLLLLVVEDIPAKGLPPATEEIRWVREGGLLVAVCGDGPDAARVSLATFDVGTAAAEVAAAGFASVGIRTVNRATGGGGYLIVAERGR